MKKRCISLILSVILLFSLALPAWAEQPEQPVELRSPKEVLNFGLRNSNGPLSITKGVLTTGSSTQEVYLICLSGAGYDITRYNNFIEFLESAASVPTLYLRTLKKAVKSTVPAGSSLIFTGHSLGGTTAQQFAADREMRSRYNILNVCACGSPYILELQREGTLHRLSDVLDPIPQISLALFLNLFLDISYENGGYFGKLELAHAKSYYNSSVWDHYDCLGVKNGSARFTCLPSDVVNFSLKISLFG